MIDNEKLNSALEEGETVQWSGVPQPYSLFDPSRRSATIYSLICALIWSVLTIGGYYMATASSGAERKIGFTIFLLAIGLLIIWMPLSDKGKIKKLLYAVTNKRVLIVSKDNSNQIAMPFANIDAIRVDQADNGNCNVRVGSQVFKAAPRKLPGLAYLGRFTSENDTKVYSGLVFFNVSAADGKAIANILEPAIAAAKA